MAKKTKMTNIDWVATILVLVGALNWGLVAIGFNLVEAILGVSTLAKIVYGIVGISALYSAYKLFIK